MSGKIITRVRARAELAKIARDKRLMDKIRENPAHRDLDACRGWSNAMPGGVTRMNDAWPLSLEREPWWKFWA